jgi:hypothetical protein
MHRPHRQQCNRNVQELERRVFNFLDVQASGTSETTVDEILEEQRKDGKSSCERAVSSLFIVLLFHTGSTVP